MTTSYFFYSINIKEACSDLFYSGLTTDTLQLIYIAKKNVRVKVKTPSATTRETIMGELVIQGHIWASTMASVQYDAFGKELLGLVTKSVCVFCVCPLPM